MVRGAFGRFLPSATGLTAALLFIPVVSDPSGFSAGSALIFGVEMIGITLGFFGALCVMRGRLDSAANVAGRRSAVAAVASVVGLLALSTVVQGLGFARVCAAALSVGGLSAFALFWPWLRREVSEKELRISEEVDVEALAEAQYRAQKLRSRSVDGETI
jgi:hypothetical protein